MRQGILRRAKLALSAIRENGRNTTPLVAFFKAASLNVVRGGIKASGFDIEIIISIVVNFLLVKPIGGAPR